MNDSPTSTGPPPPTATADAPNDSTAPHPGRAVPWPPTPSQRGLSAPYPPGGVDPEPDAGQREERFYLRLLVAMIVLIVVGGFAIGFIGLLLGFVGGAE